MLPLTVTFCSSAKYKPNIWPHLLNMYFVHKETESMTEMHQGIFIILNSLPAMWCFVREMYVIAIQVKCHLEKSPIISLKQLKVSKKHSGNW